MKSVIFDMDGVLVDNRDVHIEAFVIFCRRYGMEVAAEDIISYFGMGNDDILRGIFSRELTDEEVETMSQEKESIYRDIFAEKIAPLAGLVDFIKDLKARDIKIAVGSSGMLKNVDFVLKKCGIEQYFDAKAYGDLVEKAKPAPDIFLLAAKLLGVPPSECVVFEDSFAGIEAARRAGMKVVAVATTFPREQHHDYDLIINNFTQVTAESLLLTFRENG